MSDKDILITEYPTSFDKFIQDDYGACNNKTPASGKPAGKYNSADPNSFSQTPGRQFNQIQILLNGIQDVQVGANYTRLKPNDLVMIPENMIYKSILSQNCVGFCICFKTEFMQPLFNGKPLETIFPYFDLKAEHIIHVKQDQSAIIQHAFRDIIKEYFGFSSEKYFLLRNYTYILLLRIREIYQPHPQEIYKEFTQSMKLANRFKHLLDKHFGEMRSVKQYASHLNITPKHLSDVVKKTFGMSPRQMINETLLREAKVLLGSTDLTVSEIAYKLQFHDHSHFSHFIMQHMGRPPHKLRKNL